MYILEDDFTKIIITEEEKNLLLEMDSFDLKITKIEVPVYLDNLRKIKEGQTVYFCSENEIKKCELKDIKPFYIDMVSYDNDYILYSYILANTEEEAKNIFNLKLEKFGIYKNGEMIDGVNIDKQLEDSNNNHIKNTKIEMIDHFPKRTKMQHQKSEEMLKSLDGFFLK